MGYHNDKRALHCTTPLMARSVQLEAEAQAFVDSCPIDHGSSSSRNGAGENLMWLGGPTFTTDPNAVENNLMVAVDTWYGQEVGNYNCVTGESTGGPLMTAHFTAIVWRSTTEIGCAVKTTGCFNKFGPTVENTVVACRYNPPGNFAGQYISNIGCLVSSGTCSSNVVSFTTTVAGTTSDFDTTTYNNNVASVAGVSGSSVSTTIVSASVGATSIIQASDYSAAQGIVSNINALNTVEALSAALGVTVVAFNPPTITSEADDSSVPSIIDTNGADSLVGPGISIQSNSSGLTESDAAGVAAAFMVVVIVILVVGLPIFCYMRQRGRCRVPGKMGHVEIRSQDSFKKKAQTDDDLERQRSFDDALALAPSKSKGSSGAGSPQFATRPNSTPTGPTPKKPKKLSASGDAQAPMTLNDIAAAFD